MCFDWYGKIGGIVYWVWSLLLVIIRVVKENLESVCSGFRSVVCKVCFFGFEKVVDIVWLKFINVY